jgi:hypothetical protein
MSLLKMCHVALKIYLHGQRVSLDEEHSTPRVTMTKAENDELDHGSTLLMNNALFNKPSKEI